MSACSLELSAAYFQLASSAFLSQQINAYFQLASRAFLSQQISQHYFQPLIFS
jgi:hypothetical protein